ncbi:hypothetical protein [Eubacterium oxidoreducens]|uniref:CHC2 zinc finger n=1 Tax=Eubacterium oxidoreducens TaxID=1732 RepID=A0A1G6C3N4_EUBOX|nr:hypothetical protein [Eubacterium oxidoreducens]SDB27471.1 hypothetical protein SAMN02910417_02028 [Eubacterium oxidoreducens]
MSFTQNEIYGAFEIAKENGMKILSENNDSISISCPECQTEKRGKCNVNRNGLCHCFRCNYSGNIVTLVSDFANISTKEAYRKIMRASEGEIKPLVFSKPAFKSAVKESSPYIDKALRKYLDKLTLKSEHKADLLRRGLNEEQIKVFKSVPTKEEFDALKLPLWEFIGVPPFFEEDGRLALGAIHDGYYCPAFDEEGRIVGMQIKIINGKYIWASSKGKPNGTPSGAPMTVLGKGKELIVTEGILKAYVTYALLTDEERKRFTIAGIAGVTNLAPLSRHLAHHSYDACFEALDMDKLGNDVVPKKETVAKATDIFYDVFSRLGYKFVPLKWNGAKGIDDLLCIKRRK